MIPGEPRIALAASPRGWAQRLHRHVADHGGALVRATVLHPRDAVEEDYDVFIGDDCTSFLTRRLIDELHRRDRGVLGVYDPDDPAGKGELIDLGVDDVITRGATAEEFVAAVVTVAARTALPTAERTDAVADDRELSRPAASEDHRRSQGEGRLLVVAGAGGGTGATEVCIGLAAASGAWGDATALVDADVVAPALAQRLSGPAYPNLRAAVDVLEQRSGPVGSALTTARRFDVLPGLSHPSAWVDLRPTETAEVARALTASHHLVVCDVGHRLEDLHGFGGPARYGVGRALVAAGDAVVVVCAPSPVGLSRLFAAVAEIRALAPRTPVHVVCNRAPSSAFKQGEVAVEITRTFAPATLWFAPQDPRVEKAAWAGAAVASGPFTRAIAAVAHAIVPPATRRPRSRWRRHPRGPDRDEPPVGSAWNGVEASA